jgi:hypothetical protein
LVEDVSVVSRSKPIETYHRTRSHFSDVLPIAACSAQQHQKQSFNSGAYLPFLLLDLPHQIVLTRL